MKSRLWGAVSAGIFSFLSTATPAALVDNGGGLIYDDVLDITWAQPDAFVNVSWDDADTWAAGLTLGGVSDWRLPYISVAAGAGPFPGTPVDCSTATEVACRDNELGYMFYYNLSGSFGSILASGDPDLALFPTLLNGDNIDRYWSNEIDPIYAWSFSFVSDGNQSMELQGQNYDSWAVHTGNIGAVPVPAAVWLFGSGLIGLLGLARRK